MPSEHPCDRRLAERIRLMGADTLLVILIVVLIIVIMIRGPKTLPLIGGMLGRGVKEARKEAAEFQKERDGTAGDQPPTTPTTPAPPST
jgi:Sec-independent protein translocase protein TatA